MAFADPSIILGGRPIDVPDQTNLLLKALQAQSLMGQNQLQGIQTQQAQQGLDRANALTQYFKNQGQTDDPTTRNNTIMGLDPINGPGIVEKMLNTQKTQGDITKQGVDLGSSQRQAVASLAGALAQKPDLNPNDLVRFQQEAQKLGVQVTPQDFAGATDVDGARAALIRFQSQGMTPDQQVTAGRPGVIESPLGPVSYNKANPNAGYNLLPQQGATQAPPVAPQAPVAPPQAPTPGFPSVSPQQQTQRNGEALTLLTQELADHARQSPADQAAIKAEIARYQQAGATGQPFSVSMNTGAQTAQPTAATPSAPVAPTNPFMKFEVKTDPNTGRMVAVSTTPGPDGNFVTRPVGVDGGDFKPTTADQALIDQIGKGQIPYPSGNALRNPHTEQILAAVAQQYPSSSATDYQQKLNAVKAFGPNGKAGQTIRSLSVADDHLGTLSDAATALNNGQYPIVNQIANAFNVQTGGTAVGSFNAVKQIVGDEVVKAVIGGAGGVGDREGIQATINSAKTPQDLANVIQHFRTLMAAQKEALLSDYQNATGNTDAATRFNYKSYKGSSAATPNLSPDIQAAYAKYGIQ